MLLVFGAPSQLLMLVGQEHGRTIPLADMGQKRSLRFAERMDRENRGWHSAAMAADEPKLVSVVMPCFNAGAMLRPALQSVIDQTYPHLEVIFIDNNSTDNSRAVAEEIATATGRSIKVMTCPAQGVNHSRNRGYDFARGDYIQWMDADDRLDPDKIALQVSALERHRESDIAYGDWTSNRIEAGKRPVADRKNLTQIDDQVHRTLAGIWYPPHLYLLRRAAAQRLQELQAWWPGRPVATDVEYSAIAALAGLRFLHVPGAHVHYNVWGNTQISGATPYALRAATLQEIFTRLCQFSKSGDAKAVLSRRHKVLLEQSWDIVRMPADSVVLTKGPGRRVIIRHKASGKEIDLRPREAAIATLMMSASQPLTSCHHGLMIMQQRPDVADDPVVVVEAIELLRRNGFLEAGDRNSP